MDLNQIQKRWLPLGTCIDHRTEEQQYLGMVTYLGKFLPQQSDITASLRLLLEKNAEGCWGEAHDKSFEELKRIVSETTTLKYYDPAMPVAFSVMHPAVG